MHDVKALIAKDAALTMAARKLASAVVCRLVQGFSLLPIADALAKELTSYGGEQAVTLPNPVPELSAGLQALALEISYSSAVAYIFTAYFGGQGKQDALVWDKGTLCFSPTSSGYDQDWPNSPISQALRMIGVVAEKDKDEFDTLGLGKHRETHQWVASVMRPK
jgi:hypothetical protein